MSDIFASAPIVLRPVASIIIPEDRQRKEAKADASLVNSIRVTGLLNPIIIHEDGTLIAGERRLDAFKQLGFDTIPTRSFEQLTGPGAFFIELLENIAREQLTWQEETKAVAQHHANRLAAFPAWTMHGTAEDLGFSLSRVQRILAVAKYIEDPDIHGATTFTGAYNLIDARANRTLAAAQARGLLIADDLSGNIKTIPATATKEERTQLLLDNLSRDITQATSNTSNILDKLERSEDAAMALKAAANTIDLTSPDDDRIITASFFDWVDNYTGPRFDVLHCDFPYGKNYTGSRTRRTGAATTTPAYADEADIYFALVTHLLANQERIILPEAHCIFWFDMIHYQWTIEVFKEAGWSLVQPFPLIWTKNYQGVASDPKRRPRHCYETALLFSYGDRKLRNLDQDIFEMRLDEKLHMSQKPIPMLQHFLHLVVDEFTHVLDPTCGSGSALVAAAKLGAADILGIEQDASNADIARFLLLRELGNA